MNIRPHLLLAASLTCFTACATQSLTSSSVSLLPGTVRILSTNIPEVRGYSLDRVPALLESLAGQQLSALDPMLQGTVELEFRSGTDYLPANGGARKDDPQPPITWFIVDYRLKDSSGQNVSHGTLTATGPEPTSFSSIHMLEQAVVMGVAVSLRRKLAKPTY